MKKVLSGLMLLVGAAFLSASAHGAGASAGTLQVVVTVSITQSASIAWVGVQDPVNIPVNFTALNQTVPLTIPNITCTSPTGSGVALAVTYTNTTGCAITVTPPATLAAGANGPVTGSVTSPATLGAFTAGAITATITATVQ